MLCELARTDHHRFRVLEPDSDATKAIRALTRGREDLVGARTAFVNRCAPSWSASGPARFACLAICTARSRWRSWSGIRARPTRAGWARRAFGRFWPASATPGGRSRSGCCGQARRGPRGPKVGELELATRRPQLVCSLVAMIKTLNAQITELERQIATAIHEHPDGQIFLSLFKGTVITAAELLAEIGDCRGRYPTRDVLAGDAGQAAVAIESGKRKAACFRWGCNKRLRQAFHTLADSTRHWHPWAQDLYAQARARGHDHPRALRTVGRAWSRIVWRCWQDGVPYDPAHHRALQRHITVTIPTTSGPVPDLAATQRMAGAAVTRRAASRAERNALDSKPTSAQPAARPAKRRRG